MPRFATAPTPFVTVRTVRILYILDTPLTLKSGWYPLRRPEEPAQRPRQTTKTLQMNTYCTYETNEKHPSSSFSVHFFFLNCHYPTLASPRGVHRSHAARLLAFWATRHSPVSSLVSVQRGSSALYFDGLVGLCLHNLGTHR